MTEFTRSKKSKPGCSWLLKALPWLETSQVQKLFAPLDPGYDDPEKGYQWELSFDAPDGQQIKLYDRWGVWRIGGCDDALGDEFEAWLKAQIYPPGYQPSLADSLEKLSYGLG